MLNGLTSCMPKMCFRILFFQWSRLFYVISILHTKTKLLLWFCCHIYHRDVLKSESCVCGCSGLRGPADWHHLLRLSLCISVMEEESAGCGFGRRVGARGSADTTCSGCHSGYCWRRWRRTADTTRSGIPTLHRYATLIWQMLTEIR